MRVAAVDCGTNSIRLLIADIDGGEPGTAPHLSGTTPGRPGTTAGRPGTAPNLSGTTPDRPGTTAGRPGTTAGRLVDVDRRLEIVRLGQDVDRTGRFAPEALARTFAACRRYAALINTSGAERVRFVATSATRDAANRDEFVAGVREILGVQPEVISGEEEARLSFTGATRELAGQGFPTPYLVVDIGGGSTEFVLGGSDESVAAGPQAAVSVDLGCVRLTERCLPGDPPTEAEIADARAEVDRQLDKAALTVPFEEARTLIGLAGTVTTVAAASLDLPAYDSNRLHHACIPASEVHAACGRLLAMDHDERRRLPYMHPGRVDVIGGGSLILDRLVARIGRHLTRPEVVVSEHDILDGIAWSCVDAETLGS
ncbi:MAG: exopolyphosphatase [Actinopolymorphaceae bacterium]